MNWRGSRFVSQNFPPSGPPISRGRVRFPDGEVLDLEYEQIRPLD